MEIKLVLNPQSFPNKFSEIEITIPKEENKIKYVEKMIIRKINEYNPKLNLSCIIYEDLKEQFSRVKTSNYTGAIIRELEISANEIESYKKSGFYIFEKDNKIFARSIIEYVYISSPTADARNSAISQVIFPTHIEYMNEFKNSPSHYVADHKFMFINIIGKSITAQTILRHIASLIAIKFDYVEIFHKSINNDYIVNDIKKFIEYYNSDSKFEEYYDSDNNIFDNDCYKIDFSKKEFYIGTKYLERSIIYDPNTQKYSFHGSSEKFFWMEVYPMVIYAFNSGYKVNYSEYEEICNKYYELMNHTEKISRCIYLLNYIKKYIGKWRNV